jgi:hypothetical protein
MRDEASHTQPDCVRVHDCGAADRAPIAARFAGARQRENDRGRHHPDLAAGEERSRYWLQCEYANTTAQIYRRLPADVTRCDVTYERNVRFGRERRRVVKKVDCE